MYLSNYETCCELIFWQILIVFLLYEKTSLAVCLCEGQFCFFSMSHHGYVFVQNYIFAHMLLKCNRNWAHKEFNLQTPYLVLTEKIISLQSWFWKVCQTESVGVAIYCFCALRLKSILRCKWANVQFLTLVCIQRNNREWWW